MSFSMDSIGLHPLPPNFLLPIRYLDHLAISVTNFKLCSPPLPAFDPNDHLAKTVSDHCGRFCVRGSEKELGAEEPLLTIEHNCSDKELPPKEVGGTN